MKFAFYKGNSSLTDKFISSYMRGPYSHVESILAENADGTYTIASSVPGTGVRTAYNQSLPAADWDIVETQGDLDMAVAWFKEHDGAAYDYIGLFGFVLRPVTIEERGKFWCSEACLLAIGYKGAWREDPNSMYNVVRFAQFGSNTPGDGA